MSVPRRIMDVRVYVLTRWVAFVVNVASAMNSSLMAKHVKVSIIKG